MKRLLFVSSLVILFLGCKKNTVTDIDGNTYKTVTIGTQVWMAENLKTTKYRNGDQISSITDSAQWRNLNTGAYCNYNNDINYVKTYGYLYNAFAVADTRNLAPEGWHIATKEAWDSLIIYLSKDLAAGGKLKEMGLTHWKGTDTVNTNESGFKALPGGCHSWNGSFSDIGKYGVWWTSSKSVEFNGLGLFYFSLSADDEFLVTGQTGDINQNWGFSVRCIKD